MGRVVMPMPHSILMQSGSGFAFTHVFMESLSEFVTEESLDLLLVTVGGRMEMNRVDT